MGDGLDCFKHLQFARFDNRYNLFALDGGKGVEKILDGLTPLEIINQIL